MWRLILVGSMILVCQQIALPKQSSTVKVLTDVDRAVAFAIEQEVHANRLESRQDVCLGFGNGLALNEKGIIAELNHRGLKLRPNGWCNQGPRGSVVAVIAPIDSPEPNVFQLVVQLGDLRTISQEAEHFGTLLRQGTYIVQCKAGDEPELISYRKTCCPKQSAGGSAQIGKKGWHSAEGWKKPKIGNVVRSS